MTDLIKNNNFTKLSKAFEVEKLSEILEEASRSGGRKNGYTKKKSFSPSSFYHLGNGVCPRYWYFALNGEEFEYENTARQRANMDSGTAAGDRIAKLFDEAGLLLEAEAKAIYSDPPIFGYIDLIVEWQGEEMIGEVKTTKTESFATRAAEMKAPGYQMIQLLLYMYVKGKDKGFFVIEDKNTHELLVIPVKMTDERKRYIEYVLNWMRAVYRNAHEGDLPVRPFTKSSFNCKSCPVKKACWPEGKYNRDSPNDPLPGKVELLPLEVIR